MAPKKSTVVRQFLLVRDRKNDQLVLQQDFGTDDAAAVHAYNETEKKYRGQPWMDVLLVGADSIETVKKTHSTYFKSFTRADLDVMMRKYDVDALMARRRALASA